MRHTIGPPSNPQLLRQNVQREHVSGIEPDDEQEEAEREMFQSEQEALRMKTRHSQDQTELQT
jgi:hypothetical protein